MRYIFLCSFLVFSNIVSAQTTGSRDTVMGGVRYHYVEQMPAPEYSFSEYIARNIKYPDSAREYGVGGRVVVSFVVNEDGSISDCRVVKGIGYGCDQEAIRLIRNMPRWKPAMQDGRPVKETFALPVIFQIL